MGSEVRTVFKQKKKGMPTRQENVFAKEKADQEKLREKGRGWVDLKEMWRSPQERRGASASDGQFHGECDAGVERQRRKRSAEEAGVRRKILKKRPGKKDTTATNGRDWHDPLVERHAKKKRKSRPQPEAAGKRWSKSDLQGPKATRQESRVK